MSDYIKREDALKAIGNFLSREDDYFVDMAKGTIKLLPSVDVAPVRYGRWVLYKGNWYCSACGYCMEWCLNKPIEDWCGSCGARMDGENDE